MKVLVVSHNPFSTTHNNGKTLSAIFSAFRPEELCQLYFTAIGNVDFERCKDYYFISDQEALKSIVIRNKCGYVQPLSVSLRTETSNSNNKKFRPNKIIKILRSLIWKLSSWYGGGLNNWLLEQGPDIIFYVGGDSFFSHRIAVKLSKKLRIPMATYFTDDYVLNPPTDLYNYFLKLLYLKTISQSSTLFAIGAQMAEDYSVYFHRNFKPIMNIVDIPILQPMYAESDKPITIGYFGGLHLGRTREIIRFASFMRQEVSCYLNKEFRISVYSFASPTEAERKEMENLGVLFHSGITGAELKEKMQKTDVLLHVESIEKKYRSLTKLSVSTKIPEYMSLAKPIIAFGPADVASFRVIYDANSTMVICDENSNQNMKTKAKNLAEVLNSSEAMCLIAKLNYEYAKANFDKNIVAKQFRSELLNLVSLP